MTPDIRVGDRFLIEVTVTSPPAHGHAYARAGKGDVTISVSLPSALLLTGERLPPAIRVGDRVFSKRDGQVDWQVEHIRGNLVWISRNGADTFASIHDLTFCDEASS